MNLKTVIPTLIFSLFISVSIFASDRQASESPILTKTSSLFFWPQHNPEQVKTCSVYKNKIEISSQPGGLDIVRTINFKISDDVYEVVSNASKGDVWFNQEPVPGVNLVVYNFMIGGREEVLLKTGTGDQAIIYRQNKSTDAVRLVALLDEVCK